MLVKIGVGISTYSRTKPLFRALRIEHFEQLYLKHKIFFLKQIVKNELTHNIFSFLDSFQKDLKSSVSSFSYQLKQVKDITRVEATIYNCGAQLKWLDEHFASGENEIHNNLVEVLNNYDINRFYVTTKQLNELLYVDFRNRS